ncbi:MAG: formate dehydrogenase subunit alpha [Desulfovibrio sp.]|jgi:formate dehydrogenase alpha subunit|nr:formate dehydrogenase subunit alpha [Desulfovibrio sp.]
MSTRFVPSLCAYCGTGCGVVYQVADDVPVAALPNPACQVNRGRLCIKGWSLAEHLRAPGRLTTPLIRHGADTVPASWDKALALTAERLRRVIDKSGPDAVMVLSSARITNEENYLAQKFARTVIGTNNVDHCARLCHSASVAGLAATLGSGAMTNSMEDLEKSRCILIIGSNTTECHPLLASRILRARAEGAAILVADPRTTQLAGMATLHLRLASGTDVALLNAMCHVILRDGLQVPDIASKTEGFEEFSEMVKSVDLAETSALTGLPVADIERAARLYANGPSAICYAMGITQYASGTDRVGACANLALLCGNIGVPGGGVNPLRGQNNVQGACDMGALPDSYPGYVKVADPKVREAMAAAWGTPLPDRPGLKLTELPEAMLDGRVKALYVIGENPLRSDPDIGHLAEAMKSLDFLVVQDIFHTATTALADVTLPAAASAEKDGTFTNTERRCSRLRRAIPPPGDALPDGDIIALLASAMGHPWKTRDAEAIFDEMRGVVPSYAGMTYERLGIQGLQWPCPTPDHPGTPILHVNGCTRGKGKFMLARQMPPAEAVDDAYPFTLSTGRNFAHYHTATMTGASPTLAREGGHVYVEMHPSDAQSLEIAQGMRVRIDSRRGAIHAYVRITPGIRQGTVFVPFHYGEGPANALTIASLDPVCGIPEFKRCAVRIAPDEAS